MKVFAMAFAIVLAATTTASAAINDDFSYANSAAFESVYTLSSTNGISWNASFDGSKMTVSNSTPATLGFDHVYARRSIGSVTGDFNASVDLTWSSANQGGERSRIALQLLKGDGTGVNPGPPQFAPWTFANDGASAGLWNDYGINAVTLLIGGLEDPTNPDTSPQFPWRPGPSVGTSGAASVSINRVGGNLTATYNDGNVVRSYTVPNTDEFTHVGIWYSHFTGFPGQFDGSATYTVDNLVVSAVPEPASTLIAAVALAGLAGIVSRRRS
jgi:MYXO-CTERM domain-containing protein